MIKAVKNHLDIIRKYGTETDESFYSCGWLMDISRCIYTPRYNDIIGKTKAGEWALKENFFRFKEFVQNFGNPKQSFAIQK